MGWDLEADINFRCEPTKLIEPFIKFFLDDIKKVYLIVAKGKQWPKETIEKYEWETSEDVIQNVSKCLNCNQLGDVTMRVLLSLKYELKNYSVGPELLIYGSDSKGISCRRGFLGEISFSSYNAWREDTVLTVSGRKVDENLLSSFLKFFCEQAKPDSLYLTNMESVSIPINEHFIYHSDISGFVDDLNEIIRLFLYGGQGYYNDQRSLYKAALFHYSETMLLCGRRGEYLQVFRDYMLDRLTKLEKLGTIKVDRDILEDAVLKSDLVTDFFFDSNGLGVYAKPLLGKYLDGFFIELIDALLGENGPHISWERLM